MEAMKDQDGGVEPVFMASRWPAIRAFVGRHHDLMLAVWLCVFAVVLIVLLALELGVPGLIKAQTLREIRIAAFATNSAAMSAVAALYSMAWARRARSTA